MPAVPPNPAIDEVNAARAEAKAAFAAATPVPGARADPPDAVSADDGVI